MNRLRWMRRSTLFRCCPPRSPERDDPAEPDHKGKTISCHPERSEGFSCGSAVFKRNPSSHGKPEKQNGSLVSACVSYREFLNIMITVLTYRIKYDIVKSQSQRSPGAMIARQRSVFFFNSTPDGSRKKVYVNSFKQTDNASFTYGGRAYG